MRCVLQAGFTGVVGLALVAATSSAARAEIPSAAEAAQTVVVPATPEQRPVVTETEGGWPRGELIASGLVSFGISYGAAVVVAGTSSHQGDDRLYVPIVGPWLDLGNRGDCPINSSSCDNETTNKVLLVIDGVFQAAGVAAVLGGVLAPAPEGTTVVGATDTKVHIAPTTIGSATSPGLAAYGHF